jgi:hypothetical protein
LKADFDFNSWNIHTALFQSSGRPRNDSTAWVSLG